MEVKSPKGSRVNMAKQTIFGSVWNGSGQIWKLALTLLFLTAKMGLVRAEAESVLENGISQPDMDDSDLFTLLMNSERSWQGQIGDEDSGTAQTVPGHFLPGELKGLRSKKHLGSVAAASGLRRPSEDELERFNAQAQGQLISFKRGIPPTLRKYFFGHGAGSGLIGSTTKSYRQKKDNSEFKPGQNNDDDSDYAGRFSERSLEAIGDPLPLDLLYREASAETNSPFREKRFMGTLARGGWFPREFRGYVAGPQWDKRHVGAFARLGWMPHSKFNRQTEQGFKRNLASLRNSQIWIPKEERQWKA